MASGATKTEEDDGEAAVMELTLVSAEGHKIAAAEEKRCHIVFWIDPSLKQRVRVDRIRNSAALRRIYFPLHQKILEDATSSVTIELVYSPRLPFHRRKLLGSGVLPLSSVQIAPRRSISSQPILLPLKTPSGRFRGVVTVSARILWDLGFPEGDGGLDEKDLIGGDSMQPTAPPLPEEGSNSWLTLAGGVAAATTALIMGVAFRRLKI